MPDCSIVILNWNGRGHLERFLPSVVRFSEGAEIVVADNGSNDDSLEFLAANYPQVRLVVLDRNYGFAEGYNLALNGITSKYSVLLNSDVELTEGWLRPLLSILEGDEKVAAVMPKIRSYVSRSDFEYAGAAGGFIDMFGYPFCRGRVLQCVEEDKGQYDDRCEVFWATGACMAVRTSLFREFGGFDADFFAHQEEIDLCWRLKSAGYKIMAEPASTVYHLGGGTLAPESPGKTYLNFCNNISMLYKNLTPRSLFWTIWARLTLDGVSGFVFLLQFRPKHFRAVFRAHMSFYRRLPSLRRKRRMVQAMRTVRPDKIYRGSVVLDYFTGKRTFSSIVGNMDKF